MVVRDNHMGFPLKTLSTLTLAMVFLAVFPLNAGSLQSRQCKTTCSQQYDFCKKVSRTKAQFKACKVAHKSCKKGCGSSSFKPNVVTR